MMYYPLIRLKNCLSKPLTYGLNEPAVEDNPEWPRYIRITDFDDNDCLRDDTFKSLPPEVAKAGFLKKGDILLARSGATVGKAFHFNEDIKACYAGYLIRARFNEKTIIPKFFSYITKSVYYSDWKNRINIQATIQNISAEKYYQFEFPCPQLDIQQRIVDYLDEKTKAIDDRISVLEKKSDAYTRLKASVINRAVTRGLNPNVSLKDSGIEWIGMIPEHWEVKRMKELVKSIKSGGTPSSGNPTFYDDNGIPWVSIGDMSNTNLILKTNKRLTRQGIKDKKLEIIPKGTILYSIYATIGKVSELGVDATINQAILALDFHDCINKRFMKYQLASMEEHAFSVSNGNTQYNLNASIVSHFEIKLPPLSEQQSIAIYLDTKCSEIDKAIDNIGKQIEALKRLKRSLINEVVTGKRKV